MAKASVSTGPYDRSLHRPGTKGAAGRCSWTENCPHPPQVSAVVEYAASGKRYTWALCGAHALRVKEYFGG